MNLLIAGHSAFDTIFCAGKTTQSPGGLLYNVAAILGCSTNCDKISIITGIDEKYSFFEPVYSKVDTSLCQKIETGVRVELTLTDNSERQEKYTFMPAPLNLPSAELLKNFDGILFNFISGNDFTLENIQSLRECYDGVIYADLHTLTRGIDFDGRRFFRPVTDIEKWLTCFDVIQVNESELETITDSADLFAAARTILDIGVKALIITRGAKGASVFYKQNGEVEYIFVSAIKTGSDSCVGCGDIFGAFFFYSYVAGRNMFRTLDFAVKAAGVAADFNNKNDMYSLIGLLKDL